MAYSDTRGFSRLNPASVGAALAINGLMLAGFVMLKPDVLPKKAWKVLESYNVVPDPVPPQTPERPNEKVIPQPGFAKLPTIPDIPKFQTTTNDLFTADTGDIVTGVGAGFDLAIDPPKITDPVFTKARFDPRYSGALQPSYPPGMIRAGIEGSATVRVLVGADGRVKALEPVKSSHSDFLDATRKQALSKWRFVPATRDGEAIESWQVMTVTFVMPD